MKSIDGAQVLKNVCSYRKDKIRACNLNSNIYISTENMKSNRAGVEPASSVPHAGRVAAYEPGDILISNIRPYFKKIWKAKQRGGCSNDVLVFKAGENVDNDFLYYVLSDDAFFDFMMMSSKGTKMPRGDKDVIMTYPVPRFSIEKQRKIASILSALDDKIETNNAICRNLEEQARTLYAQWYDKRKNECHWVPLESVASINPETYSVKEKWDYVNYLDTGNITDGIISSIKKIDLSCAPLPSRARRKIKAGDVVFSTVRPNQRHLGIIHSPAPYMLVSTGFTVVRSNRDDICNELIYLLLSDESFVEKMQQIGEQSVSAYPSVKSTDIATCQLPFMDSMDYSQMQNVICSMFAQIASLQEENRKLSNIRDSLLPKLMSREFSFNIKILH